ncbi:putative ribonuclease H-like domain-containing protein, partial [Tanacetum coccineum]
MFDIDYLTDSMNYIPVSLENQANPIAGTSEVTNIAGSSEVNNNAGTSHVNAPEEEDVDAELIVILKEEKPLSSPQETEASITANSGETPNIQAFRRELNALTQKHLGIVPAHKDTNTFLVNSGKNQFIPPETGIFYDASYDEEGVFTDFNSLPTEIEVSPTPTLRIHNIHPKIQIHGDPKSAVQTRSKVQQTGAHALIRGTQKDLPPRMKVIGTKWVYRNKRDERGVVVRNKASTFLCGTIDEEVYVAQPPGLIDYAHPKKVYKVVKALYGLHQAPRAWYATLSIFLEKHGYKRGSIDKTLFIKRDKKDIMLVQVYVDDIIFGSTKKSWCDDFKALMKSIFQMSSMGELTFFL